MTIKTALFPPANRTAAFVAFLRTFWQTIRGVGGLTILGGGALVINHAATIDWPTIGWAAVGIVGSGILAGLLSGGDILSNGLPAAYIATVTPADIVSAVKLPAVTPTLAGRHTAPGADYPFTWQSGTPLTAPTTPPPAAPVIAPPIDPPTAPPITPTDPNTGLQTVNNLSGT